MGIVKRKMRYARPKTMQKSWRPLSEQPWAFITPEQYQTDDSMPRRIAAVIQAKEPQTKVLIADMLILFMFILSVGQDF